LCDQVSNHILVLVHNLAHVTGELTAVIVLCQDVFTGVSLKFCSTRRLYLESKDQCYGNLLRKSNYQRGVGTVTIQVAEFKLLPQRKTAPLVTEHRVFLAFVFPIQPI
jgi:hypothetical protein